MKMKDFRELLVEFNSLLLGLWKLFRYSPKRGSVFEKVQIAYQKKSLKILKACTTRWLSHGTACKRVLERFEELLITLDNLIEQSYEAEIRGYRAMLSSHRCIFTVCLLADVLTIINIFSLFIQKEGRKFTDIKIMLQQTTNKMQMMIELPTNKHFADILDGSFNAQADEFVKILCDYECSITTTRHTGNQTTIEEYHLKYGRPMLKCLIEEINEAFQTNDFPVLDAFHAIDPRYFHKIAESSRGTLLDTLYDWYGKNKVDVFENLRNEASALIKCQ